MKRTREVSIYIAIAVIGWIITMLFGLREYSYVSFVFTLVSPLVYGGFLVYIYSKLKKHVAGTPSEPGIPDSIANIYKKNKPWRVLRGEKRFFCIRCAHELKMTGRFECLAGHISPLDRHILEHCHKCNYQFEYIRCNHCGAEINLHEKTYIEEEILNLGKKYISRENHIMKFIKSKRFIFSFAFGTLIYSLFWFILALVFKSLMNAKTETPITVWLCVLGLCVMMATVGFGLLPTTETIIRNPYDRQEI
jgi:hypothetical protein